MQPRTFSTPILSCTSAQGMRDGIKITLNLEDLVVKDTLSSKKTVLHSQIKQTFQKNLVTPRTPPVLHNRVELGSH